MSKLSYYTKLSGTSFRQEAIAKLVPGRTKLRIVAQDDNEYDPYACEVQALLDDWTQIGWIAKGKNQAIHDYIKSGGDVDITLKDVTGLDKDTLGVNVGISYGKDESVDVSTLDKQLVEFGDSTFVYWDEKEHKAYDENGNELQSGSATEHKYLPEPDFTYPAKAIAKHTGLRPDDIRDLWDVQSSLAKLFGTLVHNSIECRFNYHVHMDSIDEYKQRDLSAENWFPYGVGDMVDSLMSDLERFLTEKTGKFSENNVYPEARIKYKNLTGIADLIYRVGEDGFYLFDYKTNRNLGEVKYDKFGKQMRYTVQQNHYRTILEKNGLKCLGMYLIHYEGVSVEGLPVWTFVKLNNIDLDGEIK